MKTLHHTLSVPSLSLIYDLIPTGKEYYESVGMGETLEKTTYPPNKSEKTVQTIRDKVEKSISEKDVNGNVDAALNGDCPW